MKERVGCSPLLLWDAYRPCVTAKAHSTWTLAGIEPGYLSAAGTRTLARYTILPLNPVAL